MFGWVDCLVHTNMLKELVFCIILNSILADAAHVRHFAHDLVEIESISHNEHVRHNEPAVIALVPAAQRGILLAENAGLDNNQNARNEYSDGFRSITFDHRDQDLHRISSIDDVLHDDDVVVLQSLQVQSFHFHYPSACTDNQKYTLSSRARPTVALYFDKIIRKSHSQVLHLMGQSGKENLSTLQTDLNSLGYLQNAQQVNAVVTIVALKIVSQLGTAILDHSIG